MDENAFVKKVVLHNKLLSPEKMTAIENLLARTPGKNLLQFLQEQGIINEANANKMRQMYQQKVTQAQLVTTRRTSTETVVQQEDSKKLASLQTARKTRKSIRLPVVAKSVESGAAEPQPQPQPQPENVSVLSGDGYFARELLLANRWLAPEKKSIMEQILAKNNDSGPFLHDLYQSQLIDRHICELAMSLSHQTQEMKVRSDKIWTAAQYLSFARQVGASDIHINADCAPAIRKDGRLIKLAQRVITSEQSQDLLFGLLSPEQQKRAQEEMAIEFCWSASPQERYRTCILKQRLGWDGAFRQISAQIPTFESLELPSQLKKLCEFHQGLILITGPAGCGKSSTMAAMIELINQKREEHIITIEDPIEFVFTSAKAHINQRQLGDHTQSFARALRSALREDPDIIVIGELRDLDTVSLAITAAETGHLVFGTLHTTSATQTIDRVINMFPIKEQNQIRSMLSESLKGIICQQLIPRKGQQGRAMAMEIMFNTEAIANLIREQKIYQVLSLIQMGKKQGMMLMDNALLALVEQNSIDSVDAYFAANNKDSFAKWSPL